MFFSSFFFYVHFNKMKAKEKVSFLRIQQDFIDYLSNIENFLKFVNKLLARNLISTEYFAELLNRYEKNYTETIKNILNILMKIEMDKCIGLLKSCEPIFFVNNMISKLMNIDEAWKLLIEQTKESRRKDNIFVTNLFFSDILLSNIHAPTVIHEIKKKNQFETTRQAMEGENPFLHEDFSLDFTKILVIGEPGIGKSAQMKSLINDWANNKWLIAKDKLLIFIDLSAEGQIINFYQTLFEQNFKNSSYITKEILSELYETECTDIILLVDGTDTKNDVLSNIISKKQPKFKTIVWSRNDKAKRIQLTYDKIFELKGLNREQLKIFFHKCIDNQTEAENLFNQFNNQKKKLTKLCRIPLFAMLTLSIWTVKKDIFQKGLYEYYEEIFKTVQGYYTAEQIEKDRLSVNHIQKLSLIHLQDYRIPLTKSLYKNFRTTYLNNLCESPYEKNDMVIIRFFHTSFQEFLAAQFVLESIKNKNDNNFTNELLKKLSKSNLSQFLNVIEFIRTYSIDGNSILHHLKLAPLTMKCLKIIDDFQYCETLTLTEDITKSSYLPFLIDNLGDNLRILSITNINNYSIIIHEISKFVPNLEILNFKINKNNFNFIYEENFLKNLIDLIINSKLNLFIFNIYSIKIQNQNSNTNDLNIEKLNIQNGDTINDIIFNVEYGEFLIKEVNDYEYNFNKINSWKIYKMIMKFLNLSTFRLRNKILTNELCETITYLRLRRNVCVHIENCFLFGFQTELLKENVNYYNFTTAVIIQNHIQFLIINNSLNIHEIHKIYYDINLFKYDNENRKKLSISEFLLNLPNCVKELLMIDCQLNVNNFRKQLIQRLIELNSLELLDFSSMKNGRIIFEDIFKNLLKYKDTLKIINLSSCQLDDYYCKLLIKRFESLINLLYLNLSGNIISIEIITSFSYLTKLKSLILSDCLSTCKHVYELSKIFSKVNQLEYLDLSENCSIKSSFSCIFQQLEIYGKSLVYLNISKCYLTEEDGISFSYTLKSIINLKILNLSGNFTISFHFIKIIENLKFLRKLEYLNISDCNLNSNQSNLLGKEISNLKSFKHLILSDNHQVGVYDSMFKYFEIQGDYLLSLDFTNCNINVESAKTLGKKMKNFPKLEKLVLSGNYKMSESIKYIFQGLSKSIKYLDLSFCNIDNYQELTFNNMIYLEYLNLSHNNKMTIGLNNAIEDLKIMGKTLKYLNLSYCSLNLHQGKRLSENFEHLCTLKKFCIAGNFGYGLNLKQIISGIDKLKDSIEFIDLSNNKINDLDQNLLSYQLENCKYLKGLNLSNNKSYRFSQIFEKLSKRKIQLTYLCLSDCKLSYEDFYSLKEFLTDLHCLEYLNLSGNFFFPSYMRKFKNANIIRAIGYRNNWLRHLKMYTFSLNRIVKEELNILFQYSNCLKTLKITLFPRNFQISSTLTNLTKFPFLLKELDLSNCNIEDTEEYNLSETIKLLEALQYLNLSGNQYLIGNCLINSITEIGCSLKSLDLSRCKIKPAQSQLFADKLTNFTKIENLNLSINLNIDLTYFLENFECIRFTLKSLNLSECNINSQQARIFGRKIKFFERLEKLNLSNNPSIEDGFSEILRNLMHKNNSLKEINFSNSMEDYCFGNILGKHLDIMTNLETLDLSGNQFSDSEVFKFFVNNCLLLKDTIKNISFPYYKLTNDTGIDLNLEKFSRLESFSMAFNNTFFNSKENIFFLNSNSKFVLSLKILNLSNCNLNKDYAILFGENLKEFIYLETLNLSDNENIKDGFSRIFNNLPFIYKSLKNLFISNCNIITDAGSLLFQTLKDNCFLEKLDLSFNQNIGSSEKINLKNLNYISNTLEILNLSYCNLDSKNGKELIDILNKFFILEYLNLSNNRNLNNKLLKIIKILPKDKSLIKEINFSNCHLQIEESTIHEYFLQFPAIVSLKI